MGLFQGAKAQLDGQKALKAHIAGNKAANDGRPAEAVEKYAQARRYYDRALAGGAKAPALRQGYAVLLLRTGEFERAREIMEAIRLHKGLSQDDWFDLRLNYAIYLWKVGRLDDAIDTIDRAAKIKKNGAIYTTLGMFLVDKARIDGDFEAAEVFNREALDYDDEDGGVLDNMAALCEARMERAQADGDAQAAAEYRRQAKALYEKAHRVKPHQITTVYALAKLCHEDGEDGRARELLSGVDRLYFSALCPVSRAMLEDLKQKVG